MTTTTTTTTTGRFRAAIASELRAARSDLNPARYRAWTTHPDTIAQVGDYVRAGEWVPGNRARPVELAGKALGCLFAIPVTVAAYAAARAIQTPIVGLPARPSLTRWRPRRWRCWTTRPATVAALVTATASHGAVMRAYGYTATAVTAALYLTAWLAQRPARLAVTAVAVALIVKNT